MVEKINEFNITDEQIYQEWQSIEKDYQDDLTPDEPVPIADHEDLADEQVQEPTASENIEAGSEMIGTAMSGFFSMRGLEIDRSAVDKFSGSLATVVEKYYPGGPQKWLSKFGDEIGLAIASFGLYSAVKWARVQAEAKKPKVETKMEQKTKEQEQPLRGIQ